MAGRLFELQSRNGILEEKDRRLYEYAYGVLLGRVVIYLIIVILGIITGNWMEMIVFLLPFTVLRQYAGGIHLEKPTSCIIFSGFLVFGCGQYLAVTSDIGFSFFFLWLIAVLVIFMLVPIDTKGKKLDKIETRIYGERARIILAIEFIMAIFLGIYGFSLLAKGIATAHLVLATGLIIGSVKKFWMRVRNT